MNPYTCGSIFDTSLIQRSYAPPRKGPKPQIPHSLDTESSQVPEVCPERDRGMLKFRFDQCITAGKFSLRPIACHGILQRLVNHTLELMPLRWEANCR